MEGNHLVMRAHILRTVALNLLLIGCTEAPTSGNDAAALPTKDAPLGEDAGFDSGAKDATIDVPAAPDRVAIDAPVDHPETALDRVEVDALPPTPDVETTPADVGLDTGGCPTGQTMCGTACVTLATDPLNCGSCGTACPTRHLCNAGACTGEQRSCPPEGGSGCGVVEITGGTFAQGDATLPAYTNASPVQPSITVSDFAVDAYEVTVGRFRRFWDAGHPGLTADVVYPGGIVPWIRSDYDIATEPSNIPTLGCDWTRTVMDREFLPLVCIDVATAQCFCVWDGGRLPTESEWEYLAKARPIEGLPSPRRYPWGNDQANTQCVVAQFGIACPGDETRGYAFREVGSYPAIGGIYDLAGNVEELTASGFADYSVPAVWGGRPQIDPFATDRRNSAGRFVYRGGRFREQDYNRMNSSARDRLPGDQRGGAIGFRCARSRPHS